MSLMKRFGKNILCLLSQEIPIVVYNLNIVIEIFYINMILIFSENMKELFEEHYNYKPSLHWDEDINKISDYYGGSQKNLKLIIVTE